jgi:hypothetical protein
MCAHLHSTVHMLTCQDHWLDRTAPSHPPSESLTEITPRYHVTSGVGHPLLVAVDVRLDIAFPSVYPGCNRGYGSPFFICIKRLPKTIDIVEVDFELKDTYRETVAVDEV